MTEQIIHDICVALPPTMMAGLAWWKAKDIHKELNSRLTQWKEETAKATVASNAASKAEGVKEGEEKANVPIQMAIIAALILLTGCSSTNITKLVGALAKDPATVAVSVQSVYGTVYLLRTGSTNQQIIMGPISVK